MHLICVNKLISHEDYYTYYWYVCTLYYTYPIMCGDTSNAVVHACFSLQLLDFNRTDAKMLILPPN